MPETPSTDQQQKVRNMLAAHGVKSYAELKALPSFQKRLQAGETEKQAFGAHWKKPERISVKGFFIGNDAMTEWKPKNPKDPKAGGTRTVKTRGPKMLLPDGSMTTIWTGSDLTGVNRLGLVEATNLERVLDLETGKYTSAPYRTDATKVVPSNGGDVMMPQIPLGNQFSSCQKRDDKRGVVAGESPDWAKATFTATVEPDSVDYFQARDGRNANLKCVLKTSDGVRLETKPSVVQACRAYGLSETDRGAEFERVLANEPTFVHGKLKSTRWTARDTLEKEGLGEHVEALLTMVQPYMKTYKTKRNGTNLVGLNLLELEKDHNDKRAAENPPLPPEDFSDGLDCGPYKVMDIREEDKGTIFYLRCRLPGDYANPATEAWPLPSVDVQEHPWSNETDSGTMNEGAFLVFLNKEGAAPMRTEKDDIIDAVLAGTIQA